MKLMSTGEVSLITGMHVNTISRQCRLGYIRGAVQIGGRWLIPEDAIQNIEYQLNKLPKRNRGLQ